MKPDLRVGDSIHVFEDPASENGRYVNTGHPIQTAKASNPNPRTPQNNNDWNAWYDFWKNPEHEGRKVGIELRAGANHIVLRVRNGEFASGGFFARLEPE